MPPACPHDLDDNAIAGYVEGRLDEAERARVERLIDECESCRRQVSALMRLRTTEQGPTTIARYQVRGELGRGGMGVVVRAWDPELEREVAIKLVRGESPDGALRLAREARAMAKVRHGNVLTVFDAGVVGGEVFVVMELIDGETLADWFTKKPPWREVLARGRAAGAGLAAAHAIGLVHRDFKPANVLCAKDGRVLVADFGLARVTGGVDAITSTGAIVGTPAYMAPEQHLGEEVGPAADQFALAATIYEGVYGQRPFAGNTLAALISELLSGKLRPPPPASDVPPGVRAVLVRGLARAPTDRWPSVQAMLDALDDPAPPRRTRWWPVIPIAIAGAGAIAFAATRGSEPAKTPPAPVITVDAAPTRLFPADHLAHWDVAADRALIDPRARAWAPDATIYAITALGVDDGGHVDIHAGGFVQYLYFSPTVAASKDLRDLGKCMWVAYVKEDQEYAAPSSSSECARTHPPGEPRCGFADIWRRARADGADATRPAQVIFSRMPPDDAVKWLFQSVGDPEFARIYPDDC